MSAALRSALETQKRCSAAASERKSAFVRGRRIGIGVFVAGTVVAAAAPLGPAKVETWASIFAALLLALAPFAPLVLGGKSAREDWNHLRAASETLKRRIWMRVAAVAPFDVPGADVVLANEVTNVTTTLGSRASHLGPVPNVNVPAGTGVQAYLDGRVKAQRDWYRTNAQTLRQQAKRLNSLHYVLAMCAAVLSVLAGSAIVTAAQMAPWIGVVATIVAAIAADAASQEKGDLAAAYTATELALDAELAAPPPAAPADLAALVARSEDAIEREHRAWISRGLR